VDADHASGSTENPRGSHDRAGAPGPIPDAANSFCLVSAKFHMDAKLPDLYEARRKLRLGVAAAPFFGDER
jgi:hypothetical protein